MYIPTVVWEKSLYSEGIATCCRLSISGNATDAPTEKAAMMIKTTDILLKLFLITLN